MSHRLVSFSLVFFSAIALCAAEEPRVVFGSFGEKEPPHVTFITAQEMNRLMLVAPTEANGFGYSPSRLLADARKAKDIFEEEGCTEAPRHEDVLTASPEPQDLVAHVFRIQPIAFVGRVVAVTPGWMPRPTGPTTGSVGTMITVLLTELLKDQTRTLTQGSLVSFIESGGTFEFEGTTFCTHNASVEPPLLQDTVVVAGHPSEFQGPSVLSGAFALTLAGDVAKPARTMVDHARIPPSTLSDIRRFAGVNDGAVKP